MKFKDFIVSKDTKLQIHDQNVHFVLFCDFLFLRDNSAYGPQKLEATALSARAEVIPFIFRTILPGKHFSDADQGMRKG